MMRVCVYENSIIRFQYERKDLAMYDELIIEEIRRQEREREEDRRLYLEIPPPPPPVKKEEVREPKRVIEIQL